jgi:archaellum component FlaC
MQVFESFEATVERLETTTSTLERDFISLREKVLQDFKLNTELIKQVTDESKLKVAECLRAN